MRSCGVPHEHPKRLGTILGNFIFGRIATALHEDTALQLAPAPIPPVGATYKAGAVADGSGSLRSAAASSSVWWRRSAP